LGRKKGKNDKRRGFFRRSLNLQYPLFHSIINFTKFPWIIPAKLIGEGVDIKKGDRWGKRVIIKSRVNSIVHRI
jgi:hypothetical protein